MPSKYQVHIFLFIPLLMLDARTRAKVNQSEFNDSEVDVEEVDPRLEALVERLFEQCFKEKQFTQACGMAIESLRLDIVEKSIKTSDDVKSMLQYLFDVSLSWKFIFWLPDLYGLDYQSWLAFSASEVAGNSIWTVSVSLSSNVRFACSSSLMSPTTLTWAAPSCSLTNLVRLWKSSTPCSRRTTWYLPPPFEAITFSHVLRPASYSPSRLLSSLLIIPPRNLEIRSSMDFLPSVRDFRDLLHVSSHRGKRRTNRRKWSKFGDSTQNFEVICVHFLTFFPLLNIPFLCL